MRLDVYAIKRTWEIRTHPITLAQARALIDHLDTFMFRSGDFWIIDFDTDGDQLPSAEESVRAYITDIREEYVPFGRDGVWHADGRQLTITVEEE